METSLEKTNELGLVSQIISDQWKVFDRPDFTSEDMRMALSTIEFFENRLWEWEVENISQRFPPSVMQKVIHRVIVDTIEKLRQYRNEEYLKIDELRVKGVPFIERMKNFNKSRIDWCNVFEEKLAEDLPHFKFRPFKEWLSEFDVQRAKRLGEGMGFIIKVNLDRCYTVPN